MWHWLHHLLEPHCEICHARFEEDRLDNIEKEAERARCKSCECMEKELSIANQRIDQLIGLLHPANALQSNEREELQPIRGRYVPWAVKQQMLQRESKMRASVKVDIADLEKELGVDNG